MPELKLFVAPASAPCRAVLLHHHLLGDNAPVLDIHPVDLAQNEHKSPEFLRHNPLHSVPTLVTPWGPLWESRAIMRLIESLSPEPGGYPLESFHRAVVDRLLDWDLGTLYRTISTIVYPKAFRGEDPSADDLDKLSDAMRFLDQKQLGDGRLFLTGNTWTIADVSCHMTMSLLRLIGLEIDDIPRVTEWNARIAALPGYAEIDAPFVSWIESLQSGTDAPRAEEAVASEAASTEPSPQAAPDGDDSKVPTEQPSDEPDNAA